MNLNPRLDQRPHPRPQSSPGQDGELDQQDAGGVDAAGELLTGVELAELLASEEISSDVAARVVQSELRQPGQVSTVLQFSSAAYLCLTTSGVPSVHLQRNATATLVLSCTARLVHK